MGREAGEQSALNLLRSAVKVLNEDEMDSALFDEIEKLDTYPQTYINGFMSGFMDVFYQYN